MTAEIDKSNSEIITLEILEFLIKDRTSKKTLKWGTNNYKRYGLGYFENDYIETIKISGRHKNLIKPRIEKSLAQQKKRSKDMAEVFTPSWTCNAQNNLVDNEWFGYAGSFNIEGNKEWTPTKKVIFPKGKTWKQYVDEDRLEITCGEAPYLVSRYDATTGKSLDVPFRIGLLDRKLRVINENVDDEKEWLKYVETAYKRVYGFDYQGDNVLLARINLLITFYDNYLYKFGVEPKQEYLVDIANIISWNIWQMDGLKFVIPNSCHKEEIYQLSLFDDEPEVEFCYGCRKNDYKRHNGIYCLIKDWRKNKNIRFVDLIEGGF